MATIYIENRPYEVSEKKNLLDACLDLGFDIPYFCWHPALGSVGSCRQCAVKLFKDDKDTKGQIVMSCMTQVKNGMRISIEDPDVVEFRKSVLEWLMLNHPHDCPVCDEGGECHLQDMTVMTGHVYRKTRFPKRTHKNQYLGPFVNHEMNRCIQCYRCVRFYKDYAGGRDLNVFAAHDHVYFGRHGDGVLESEFSGNLVEICPTGVFTDRTLKEHYTRKWDLQTAPSICPLCSLGCDTIPGERYGSLRRVLNRFNFNVNGYFICDRGRFGYSYVNSPDRIRAPRLASSNATPTNEDIMGYFRNAFHFGMRAIGIGSPRASLEANFALRTLVGPDSFYLGMSSVDYRLVALITEIIKGMPSAIASLEDIRNCDAVLVLGEDVTNTAPLADLAIRRAAMQKPYGKLDEQGIARWSDLAVGYIAQGELGPVYVATSAASKLDSIAAAVHRADPDGLARFGFSLAHAISGAAPSAGEPSDPERIQIEQIAAVLKNARQPLIVSGTGSKSEAVIRAAANIALALKETGCVARLSYIAPECNSIGLMLMGGRSIEEALSPDRPVIDTAVILECDLYDLAESLPVDRFLAGIKNLIVLDSLPSETSRKAGLLLPAAAVTESDGTFVNNEGRAQRFFRVCTPAGEVCESRRWITDMLKAAGNKDAAAWNTNDDVCRSMAEGIPVFEAVAKLAPPADFRIYGMKVPRQPHRYSGRTAMHADISVHEPEPEYDADSPLSFSMEGYENVPPSSLIARYWSPAWNSVQALNKFQSETGGRLRGGDPGIRLITSQTEHGLSYFDAVLGHSGHRAREWTLVPIYHIYGSERLSMYSPSIAGLAPKPYIALSAEDMKHLKLSEGEMIALAGNNERMVLPVRKDASLHKWVAGIPFGLPGMKWFDYSKKYHIEHAVKTES